MTTGYRMVTISHPVSIPAVEVMGRLSSLLASRSVQFDIDHYVIRSTYIPFPLVAFDRRRYSRSNWFGINPFINYSSIVAAYNECAADGPMVIVTLDRTRALLILVGWSFLFAYVIPIAYMESGSIIPCLVPTIFLIFALLFYSIIINSLARSEILNALLPSGEKDSLLNQARSGTQ